MSNLAVFVDGPLRGEVREVASWQAARPMVWRVAREPEPLAVAWPAGKPVPLLEFDDAVYRFRVFAMFGRTVLVGSVAQPPEPEDLFSALCSDAAQRSALHGTARPGAG